MEILLIVSRNFQDKLAVQKAPSHLHRQIVYLFVYWAVFLGIMEVTCPAELLLILRAH